MNRDDVDLTADQANSYIQRIYRSIQEGIDKGYLYEVEGKTTEQPTESPTEAPTTQSTESPARQGTTEKSTESGSTEQGNTTSATEDQNTESTTEAPNGTGDNKSSGDGNGETGNNGGGEKTTEAGANDDLPRDETGAIILPELQESDIDPGDGDYEELTQYEGQKEDTLDQRPQEEDADTAIIYDEEEDVLYVRVDDAEGGTYREVRNFLPDGTNTVFLILLILCAVLTLNVLIAGGLRKCFILKQKAHRTKRRGHTKRRKLRKLLRYIMTGVASLELAGVILSGALYFGLFREDAVMKSLNSSGFFRYEYAKYLEKQGVEEDKESYEEFLFHAKAEIRETLKTGETREKGVLSNSAAASLYKLRKEIADIGDWYFPAMAAGLILSFLILWFLDGVRHRGVRKMGLTFTIGFLLSGAAWVALQMTRPFSRIYVEPDYLYRFIHDLGANGTKLFLVAALFTGILAVALYGTAISMKKRLER